MEEEQLIKWFNQLKFEQKQIIYGMYNMFFRRKRR